jgi:hypothetical protein
MVHIYDAPEITPLVLDFYHTAWQSVTSTRYIFELIGLGLTQAAFRSIPLLQDLTCIDSIYAGPIARAGCGLFRPSVLSLLTTYMHSDHQEITVNSFGLGLRRAQNPLHTPATVYWNTLQLPEIDDPTKSVILIYEMGEATGSTIVGVVSELQKLAIPLGNIIFLIGAACIEQTQTRLDALAPEIHLVIGSRWRYDPTEGPTQFYLTHMNDGRWKPLPPRDWGRCVSGMTNLASVNSFIQWVAETIPMTHQDQNLLLHEWSNKIDESPIDEAVSTC